MPDVILHLHNPVQGRPADLVHDQIVNIQAVVLAIADNDVVLKISTCEFVPPE